MRLSPYQKRLFLFLSVAAFFDGYDFFAVTQVLPELRRDMQLGEGVGGLLLGVINLGTVLAYFLVRRADQVGRRPLLTATITGYTLFTGLSAIAPNVYVFGILQMLGRIFLLAESAISNVVIAEEFPAARRGTVLGIVSGFSGLGGVVCAGLVPLLLQTPIGWRAVYVVGLIPLVLIAFARRGLQETARFSGLSNAAVGRVSLFHIWRTPYRARVIALGSVWFFSYIAPQTAVSFWKEFAVSERSLTPAEVGHVITLSALFAMPLIFGAGRLIDAIGRRAGAVVIYLFCAGGVYSAYWVAEPLFMVIAVTATIFGVSAFLPLLNAYTTELFPTELRGAAFAWCNHLLGRVGYVLAPIAVGFAAEDVGWGAAVRPVAIFPIVALLIVWFVFPETSLRELEDTARL